MSNAALTSVAIRCLRCHAVALCLALLALSLGGRNVIDIAAVLEDQTGHLEQVARIGDLGPLAGLVCVSREREPCGARQACPIWTVEPHPWTLRAPGPPRQDTTMAAQERRPRLGGLS
jgi:hypothetical protein